VGLFTASLVESLNGLLAVWVWLGIGYALVQTPSGRLLTRSSHPEDRPDLFAAQFSLSHTCWLLAYPLAGWLGVKIGLPLTFILFATAALLALIATLLLWPADAPSELTHRHDALPENHPHLAGKGQKHTHPYVIDELHMRWPK